MSNKRPISTKTTSVFKNSDVAETVSTISDKHAVVPAVQFEELVFQ
jgi:hypothetical protein